jgi:hypothetical protein
VPTLLVKNSIVELELDSTDYFFGFFFGLWSRFTDPTTLEVHPTIREITTHDTILGRLELSMISSCSIFVLNEWSFVIAY